MSNGVVVHAQIASIIEALAKTAVAEICELVDDGYTVLHLEISRSQKENEVLKRKLKMMEYRVARACVDKPGVRKSAGRNRSVANPFLTEEKLLDKQSRTCLWREAESSGVDEDNIATKSVKKRVKCGEEEGSPEPIIIKEESLEEDSELRDSQEELRIISERPEELDTYSGETAPVLDTQIKCVEATDQLHSQHRTSVWDDGGLDAILKAELENETSNQRLKHTGSDQSAGRLSSLSYEYVLYERSGQLQTYFAQGNSDTETEVPACSYSTEADSEVLVVNSNVPTIPSVSKGANRSLSLGQSEEPEVVMKDMIFSAPSAQSADMQPVWSKGSLSQSIYSQDGDEEFEERERLLPKTIGSICSPLTKMTMRENTAESKSESRGSFTTSPRVKTQRRVGRREKRFICGYCGKSFTCPKYLQTHQRVHTGEKPYSCPQCGKRFAQSGYLKKHQNVHTGAKPFSCKQCGKRFADSSNLIRHRSVHTGERPYICTYCGERFAGKHHLKIHQQRNHPAVWTAS